MELKKGYKQTELGVIPCNWNVIPLERLVRSVEYGSAAKSRKSGAVSVLRMGNLQNGKIDWNDLVYTTNVAEIKKYLLRPLDVLFNRTNTIELVGKTAIREQRRETPREFLERESHYVWGKRYLLKVIEHDAPPTIELKHRNLTIRVRPETTQAKREQLIDDWYREQVRTATAVLIEKWQPILNVKTNGYYVQRMKTRWGSCNPGAQTIRINSELGKKESECLEYIVVHEMVHLLERSHNDRFRRLMDKFYPKWSHVRMQLNRAPLSHTEWAY